MGRNKLVLNGRQRGRNELIEDSILKDTGVKRDRKQVSSHLQVLRPLLKDVPEGNLKHNILFMYADFLVLAYMPKPDLIAKKSRHHGSHIGHGRSRHANPHVSDPTSKYDFASQSAQDTWDGYMSSQNLSNSHSILGSTDDSYFKLTNFAMFVQVLDRKVHSFTQLNPCARLDDLCVSDIQSWNRQYPELAFHRTQNWQDSHVLVCDSSIQIMAERQPQNAELSVQCDILSANLEYYDNLESRTRFYDAGKLADQFDEKGRVSSQTCSMVHYDQETSRVSLPFGSHFWARRMSILGKHFRDARLLDEHAARVKVDMDVRRRLQYLTAVQELHGTRRDTTNESDCVLTILWRFHQTKSTDEAGQTNWRVVRFNTEQSRKEQMDIVDEKQQLLDPTAQSGSMYPTLRLDFSQQPFPQHAHQLDLESLSTIALEGLSDFSNPQSASAPSMTTDFSTQSLPSLSHSQETAITHPQDYHDPNNIDFTGGHINLCLEPAINLTAYEHYDSTHANTMDALQSITGLEHSQHGNAFEDFSSLGVNMTPYAPKPWVCTDIIERLEGLVEQQEFADHTAADQDIAGHGVLHHGQMEHGLWKLQSPFPEDAGLGADSRTKEEPLDPEQERGLLNFGERGEKFRLF